MKNVGEKRKTVDAFAGLIRWLTMCFSLLGDSKVSATSPLSPSELLVALHQIEAKSDMKSVMKGNPVFKEEDFD